MYCPYCRAELPEGSKFCMSCGKAMPAAAPNASSQPPTDGPPPAGGRPPTITGDLPGSARDQAVPGVGAPSAAAHDLWSERPAAAEPESESRLVPVLLAVLLVLLLAGGGLWLLNRSRGAAVTTVRPAPVPGPSIVRAPAAPPGPPVTAQPAQPAAPAKPQGMPQDIRRYLSFLQSVEAQRKAYEGQLTNNMLKMIPNLLMPNFDSANVQPPDQQMVRQYTQLAQDYSQATIRFQAAARQIGVPQACRKLHAYYSAALSMNPRLIMETASSLSSGNYSGLLSMRDSVGKQIEDNYQAADQELANICAQYNIRKPFDIGNAGGGGGSILLP